MSLVFKDRRVLIVGLGKTGLALVSFALKEGARVRISDQQAPDRIKALTAPFTEAGHSLIWEGGGHSLEFFTEADLILVSPGIPLDLPALEAARTKGIPIYGEVEVFSRYCTTPVVAVTGTNGKTTTTALLNEMLVEGGIRTYLGGNIGRPLMEYVLEGEQKDLVVAEISSFQLDTTESFTPKVGLLLNITPDHLDRYPSFEAYAASKAGLFRNQRADDAAVINRDDPCCLEIGRRLKGPVYFFSRQERCVPGAFLEGNRIRLFLPHRPEEVYDLTGFLLPGTHNQENALAAVLGARLLNADPAAIRRVLTGFKGFGHRLEWVAEVDGVAFYDDSKATNVGAVVKALEGFDQPVILIAGGRDKGGDYYPLEGLIREKVKALILIGEAKERIAGQLGTLTLTETAESLEEAVLRAYALARPGDAVLLSPACSSFDMFRDYGHRGEVFQRAVKELKGKADRV